MPTLSVETKAASPQLSPDAPTPQKLDALTSLRFFAAAMIFLLHLAGCFNFLKGGPLQDLALWQGVCFFFVLSGFILTHVHSTLPDAQSRNQFLIARFARIWPTYLASLCLFMAVSPTCLNCPDGWLIGIACLCMVQSWTLDKPFFATVNTPTWSISTEFFFYLCFPFLVQSLGSTWKKKLLICLSLVAVSIWACSTKVALLTYQGFPPQVAVSPLCRIFEFFLGMLVCLLYQRYGQQVRSRISPGAATTLEVIALAAVAFCVALPRVWGYHCPNNALVESIRIWVIFSGVAPVYGALIFLFACERGWLARLLTNKFLVMLGEISFALYLMHAPIMEYFGHHLIRHKEGAVAAAIVASIIIALALSRLNFIALEMPLRKWILKIAGRSRSSHAAPHKTPIDSKNKHRYLAEILACSMIVALTCVIMSMQQRHFRFISEKQLASTMTLSRPQYLNVVLGDNFAMRGLTQTATKNGVVLDINWQSLKDQDLHYYNAVHALDVKDNVLNYCDYEQDEQKRVVKKNQFWHDHVFLSNDQLKNVASLGITVYQQKPFHQLEIRNAETDKLNRIIVALDKRPQLAR